MTFRMGSLPVLEGGEKARGCYTSIFPLPSLPNSSFFRQVEAFGSFNFSLLAVGFFLAMMEKDPYRPEEILVLRVGPGSVPVCPERGIPGRKSQHPQSVLFHACSLSSVFPIEMFFVPFSKGRGHFLRYPWQHCSCGPKRAVCVR